MSFAFGSSLGVCRTPAEEPAEVLDYGDRGNIDPDRLLQCPFDKSHQIRACRFPYHLLKCRKNHPKLASELKTCPFNASHLMPRHELARHTETCEDRTSVSAEPGDGVNGQRAWQLPVSTCVYPETTEDWDREAEDSASPFVWGQQLNQRAEPKPASSFPTFRVPNTLPWSS